MQYMGGKFRQSKAIVQCLKPYFNENTTYVEPFCGGMWSAAGAILKEEQLMEYEFERYFDFLDDLRESGVTNMFGASPYLIEEFGVDRSTAQRILIEWIRSFSERHPQEGENEED